MRETTPAIRDKYFRVEGSDLVLDEGIRSMVSFEEQNLTTCDLRRFGRFDMILCRNVIMYLVPEAAQHVTESFTQSLLPEGFLFLGYAETLRGLSHDYHLRHKQDTFYYQKRQQDYQCQVRPEPTDATRRAPNPAETAWVDAVRRASEHIDSLARCPIERSKAATNGPPAGIEVQSCRTQSAGTPRSPELGFAFELLRQERFREALEVLRRSPAATGSDSDTQLLHAGLLANCGDLEAAEAVCKQILSCDELNAGAHYLAALCREHADDAAGAIDHDRAAIYLDNSFAMPHLHLGRLAKRSADLTTARRELECAGMLLLREDPSRLLLFGGGFNREALVAFSRAELRACGGAL